MKDSIFIKANETIIHPLTKLNSISKYICGDLIVHTMITQRVIYELPLTIQGIDFIGLVRASNYSSVKELKMVPAFQMRTLIIKNINPIVPLVDIFTSISKTTTDVKKVIMIPNTNYPGVSQGIVEVEYQNHQAAMNALEIVNSQKVTINNSIGKFEAFLAEPLVDNCKELIERSTTIVMFENVNINVTSPRIFKEHLEAFLAKNNEGHVVIKKLRQYADKIVIEFDWPSKCFQKLFNDLYDFNGVYLTVKAGMKPCVNVGKYKERSLKLSTEALNEDDQQMLIMRLTKGKGSALDLLRKKAEVCYSKILGEEREREKEKEKEREKEREREVNKHSLNKKREREKEIERDRDRERDRDDYGSMNRKHHDHEKRNKSKRHGDIDNNSNPLLDNTTANLLNSNINVLSLLSQNQGLGQILQLLDMKGTGGALGSLNLLNPPANHNSGQVLMNTASTPTNTNNTKGNNNTQQPLNSGLLGNLQNVDIAYLLNNPGLLSLLQQMATTPNQQPPQNNPMPIIETSNTAKKSQVQTNNEANIVYGNQVNTPQNQAIQSTQIPSYNQPQQMMPMYPPMQKGVDPHQYYVGMPNKGMYPLPNQPNYPNQIGDYYMNPYQMGPGGIDPNQPSIEHLDLKNYYDYMNMPKK